MMLYFQTSIQRKMRFNTNEYTKGGGERTQTSIQEKGGDNANEYTREGGV